jgi:hypothetical protein
MSAQEFEHGTEHRFSVKRVNGNRSHVISCCGIDAYQDRTANITDGYAPSWATDTGRTIAGRYSDVRKALEEHHNEQTKK